MIAPYTAATSQAQTVDSPKKALPRNEKLAKVWNVVKWILLAIANAALFFLNSTLWSIGFVIGVIWDKKVQEVVDKVILLWKKRTWVMALITGVAGFLSIHVTLAVSSFTFGAHLGSTISRQAKDALAQEKKKTPQPPKLIENT